MAQRMQNSVLSMATERSREINSKVHVTKSSPQPRLRHWLTDIISELQNRTEPAQSNDLSHNPHSILVLFPFCSQHKDGTCLRVPSCGSQLVNKERIRSAEDLSRSESVVLITFSAFDTVSLVTGRISGPLLPLSTKVPTWSDPGKGQRNKHA